MELLVITCNLLANPKNSPRIHLFGSFNEIYISIRMEVGMDDILHVQNNVKNNNNLDLKSTP